MNRVFDIAVAAIGLLVLAPLLALIACVIWLGDRRSAIYRGARVGRHGRQFQILKFRTMRADASRLRQLTVADDPRVTRVGRFIRRTKLDEAVTTVLQRDARATWIGLVAWGEHGLGGSIARERGTNAPGEAALVSWLVRGAESGRDFVFTPGFDPQ